MSQASNQVLVPSIPKRLSITQTMIEDFIVNPALGAEILLAQKPDEFQKVRLKIGMWTPRVMDSSGYGTGKTKDMWVLCNLRRLLIADSEAIIAYPVFGTGKQAFWKYYNIVAARSPIFRAHMGKFKVVGLDSKTEGSAKAQLKDQSCWTFSYKNGSIVKMPAIGFMQDAKNMASLDANDLFADEHTKAEATGSQGFNDQLIQRTRRFSFNQEHPFWCNHQYFCATAEDTMHPSYERYKSYLEEVRKGNPEYGLISFSFRDFSDRPSEIPGKSFSQAYREEKVIRDIFKNKTPAGFRQEALGIWSKNGKGVYTPEMIQSAFFNGKDRGITPMCSRHDDPEKDPVKLRRVHYFMGGDVAKADQKKADDGALAVLRVEPLVEHPTSDVGDWREDFVWAYKVRKADAPEWAALIHRKDRQFDFTGIMLDHGGGGNWVRPELAKARQVIRGAEVKVVPIGCEEDEAVMPVSGRFILSMFKNNDAKIRKLWGETHTIRGDDNIIDLAHTEFIEALSRGHVVGLPPKYRSLESSQTSGWTEEKRHALFMLENGAKQLISIAVQTNDDGTTYYTGHNARVFSSRGRKDFAYAMLLAHVRFLQWLQQYEDSAGDNLEGADADQCF